MKAGGITAIFFNMMYLLFYKSAKFQLQQNELILYNMSDTLIYFLLELRDSDEEKLYKVLKMYSW